MDLLRLKKISCGAYAGKSGMSGKPFYEGDQLLCILREESGVAATDAENLAANAVHFQGVNSSAFGYSSGIGS